MGYHMMQRESKFFIAQDKLADAALAVRSLMSGAVARQKPFSWVDTTAVLRAASLVEQLRRWGWLAELDEFGNVNSIEFSGEKLGDDEQLFNAIAPYVLAGCYIQMQGEDGAIWRWVFDGVKCVEIAATIQFGVPG